MHVVFRTDASNSIGTGHVIRCLTLADALVRKCVQVSFICREHDGHLCDLIEERGYVVHRLPKPLVTFDEAQPFHASWLGASWKQDADQTCAIIKSLEIKPDWLVVDHYGIDYRWEYSIRPQVTRIFVIDDIADRVHDCDVLLDQNLVLDMQTRYSDRVPKNCILLLGPDYALLQPIYADLHDRIPPREGPIRRILISFGGADSDNLTGRALAALISLNRPEIDVDVVISGDNPHASLILEQAVGHPNIHLHHTLPTLARLMVKADLAIGAAGTTSWERLCLGLPALVVTLAENQKPIAARLHQEGLVCLLGHKDNVPEENIRMCLDEVVQKGIYEDWSLRCHQTVDGRGADRVVSILTLKPEFVLKVRHVRLSDELLLLKWANDPETRQNSFSTEPIPAESHRKWFRARLRDIKGCHIYIIETVDQIPLGQVRFEQRDQKWEIDYSIASEFRGKGLGRIILGAALQAFRVEKPGVIVYGKVKSWNLASRKVFESLGFNSEFVGEVIYYHLRSPRDNRLDPDQTIQSQFDLLRVADNPRYPVWFEINNEKYILQISRVDEK